MAYKNKNSKGKIREHVQAHSHSDYIKNFRTKICPRFLKNDCPFTQNLCFDCHTKKPQRRTPLSSEDNSVLLYKKIPCRIPNCQSQSCAFCHSLFEISFHPDHFKVIPCNFNLDRRTGFCSKNGPHCSFAHGENDLRIVKMPSSALKISSNKPKKAVKVPRNSEEFMRWYKTRECPKHNEADCNDGRACPFYHFPKERRRDPFDHPHVIRRCRYFWVDDHTLNCPAGDRCIFAHNDLEALYHPSVYKMTLCNPSAKSRCGYGDLCSRAHGENDLRPERDRTHEETENRLRKFWRSLCRKEEEDSNPKPPRGLGDVEGCDLEFDFSLIPALLGEEEELENEGINSSFPEIRREVFAAAEKCASSSIEYQETILRIVDAAVERLGEEMVKGRMEWVKEALCLQKRAKQLCEKEHKLISRLKCPICFVNERDVALVPCGHMFCTNCVQSQKRCFLCRRAVNSLQNIVLVR